MKIVFKCSILLMLMALLLTSAVISAGAAGNNDEPGKYGDGTFFFYWPKDLPLPNGKVVFKFAKRDPDYTSTFCVKRQWNQVGSERKTLCSFRITFVPEYNNVTDFDNYVKKIVKAFPNEYDTDTEGKKTLYSINRGEVDDLNTQPDCHFWYIQGNFTRGTDEYVLDHFSRETRIRRATISYKQESFVWEEDNRLIYGDGSALGITDLGEGYAGYKTAKTLDQSLTYGTKGRVSVIDFYLWFTEEVDDVDLDHLNRYTTFPLTKYYVNANGEPVLSKPKVQNIPVAQPEDTQSTESNSQNAELSEKPEKDGYSVGDVIVVGGVTFMLLLVGGVPMWVKQTGVVPNYKNNPSSSTSESKERKDFSKYGLQQTKDGNWIKQLRTREGELYHSITYDENGKPISEYILKPGNGGTVRKEILTNEKGEIYQINEVGYDTDHNPTYSSEIKYNEKHEMKQKMTYDKDGNLIEEQKKIRRESIVGDKAGDVDMITEDYIEVNKYDGDGNKISSVREDYKSSNLGKYESDWAYELDSNSMREKLKVGRGRQYKI